MVMKNFKILLSSGIELGTPGWEVQTYPTEPSGMPHERVDFLTIIYSTELMHCYGHVLLFTCLDHDRVLIIEIK